jgi:hypothetical protein
MPKYNEVLEILADKYGKPVNMDHAMILAFLCLVHGAINAPAGAFAFDAEGYQLLYLAP